MEGRERKGFYHVCTDGTVLPWMFKDTKDFIAGVNRIGICKVLSGVLVWTFSLMDNHAHFLLYGSRAMCKMFIDKYKLLTGKWISWKYKEPRFIKELPASIIYLKTEEDILETAAYIDRNSVVAGFSGLPSEYPWASSSVMFKVRRKENCRCLKEFSPNQLRDMLKTRVALPGEWTVDDQGMINPECFTELQKMENLFKTPIRYLYFVTKKLEGKIDVALSQGHKTFIPDKDLRPITTELCIKTFQTDDIRRLDVKSRLVLARILRSEYASSPKQIARMLYVDADLLKGFI